MGEIMADVGQIPVQDKVTGQERYGNEHDIMELVGMDPVKRLQTAREKFGDLGDTVAAYAKDLRGILMQRNQALEEERKNGATREQQVREQQQKQQQAVDGYITTGYTKTFQSFQDHPDHGVFLKPIAIPEGQQPTPEEAEYNAAIQKGQDDLKAAWQKEPKHAKSQEELDAIIKTRVKFGARAAAYPALYISFQREKKAHAETKAKLAQYESTTPASGGRIPSAGGGASGKRDFDAERLARTAKYARPERG